MEVDCRSPYVPSRAPPRYMTSRSLARRLTRPLARCVIACLLVACSDSAESASASPGHELPPAGDQLFTKLPSNATGVRFENRLEQSKAFNVFTYRNFYNGGGAAIADLTATACRRSR